MARSPYDLRRRVGGQRRGARRRGAGDRPFHGLFHRVHDHAPLREAGAASLMPRRVATAVASLAILLAGPATAFALNINENYHPQNEFKLDPWFSIGPIEFNKAVFYVIVATFLTCFTMIYVARRMQQHPNRLQTAVEAAYTLMRDNITRGNMPDRMAAKWFP